MRASATMSEPATMIRPDAAVEMVVRAAEPRPARSVPLADAVGLRLAETVTADDDAPPFPRAMMDGYAVRRVDAGRAVRVVGRVPAGHFIDTRVEGGTCLEIMTGAACPPETEAVVPVERTRREDEAVVLPAAIEAAENIAAVGSDCRSGQTILAAGAAITPLAVAAMASFGRTAVRVVPRPTLGIITTGTEVVAIEARPAPGQIRDANGPMLLALATALGLDRPRHFRAGDRVATILAALERVADRDIILLAGGVSVGRYDLVPEALRQYGAETLFHKVRQKPGKPLLAARRGRQLLFGLPGNPLACHLGFQRYVAAAVRAMQAADPTPEGADGMLSSAVATKGGRTHFVLASAEQGERPGAWRVHPMPGASSADVFGTAGANCYLEVPPGREPLPAGSQVAFTWLIGRS